MLSLDVLPENFRQKPCMSQADIQAALEFACTQIARNIPAFSGKCQNHSSVDNFYPPCENDQWTSGFWPGEIWLAWEHTKDPVFRIAAEEYVDSFYTRIKEKIAVDHHDMGFLYSPTCVAAWKLNGNEKAKEAALLAAEQLASRFQPTGGFIQAWGEMGAKENYRYIIDCLLNLPLLYWAAQNGGSEYLKTIADTHIKTCLSNSFRDDYSTYHTFFMDPVSGAPDHGATCQGYKDDSSWARGQAWAVYGLAIAYRYFPKEEYAHLFNGVAEYFISRLPSDLVPYWDLIFTKGNDEPRDSSSAAIVACGLLEMADSIEASSAKRAENYRAMASILIKSLYNNYAVKDSSQSNGLVLHGTYSKKSPFNTCTPEGVDECVSWGDYFYLEALTRLSKKWNPYW